MLHSAAAYASLQAPNLKNIAQNITSAVTGSKTSETAEAQTEKQTDVENDYEVIESITPDGYQYVTFHGAHEKRMAINYYDMLRYDNTAVSRIGASRGLHGGTPGLLS